MHRALTCQPERQRLDATLISFTTKLFDVTKECPNDINRLRVGNYRASFEFAGAVRIVSVEEVRKRDERTY